MRYKIEFIIDLSGDLTKEETEDLIKEQWEQTTSASEGDLISSIKATQILFTELL